MKEKIQFTLNGKPVTLDTEGDRKLLWVLRAEFGLTGTKYGCGQGTCGSCTVLVDNEAARSCQTTLQEIRGKTVITIEGLAGNGKLHPLQEAFMAHDALQCGYCTPGMIMNAWALLHRNPQPSREEIIAGMEDNLCRCGAHSRILQAVESAAKAMKGGE
jgi:aerobic-type carbon monoxide dehydrogenase small subunit (CoxS/CutS family)